MFNSKSGDHALDASQFDGLARTLATLRNRRRAAMLLGGMAATPLLRAMPSEGKGKKKKFTLCLNGETIEASSKKKKSLLKRGATSGACPTSPPPGGCTPQCGSTCGGNDGCGGACRCAANAYCKNGVCQTCTVPCDGNALACGNQLKQALTTGGTITLCPGRYAGNFDMRVASTLIGAGSGDDPATSTILDAELSGRVLTIDSGVTASLTGLRITRGNRFGGQGGGIRADTNTDVQIEDCVIIDNVSDVHGGGVHAGGRLRLSNSTVTGNIADIAGGINLLTGLPSIITNSVISRNESTRAGAGGIHTSTTLAIVGSEIRNNTAATEGGGIRVDGVTVTFDNTSQVINNTAGGEGGGGIFVISTGLGRIIPNGVLIDGNTGPECVGVGCPA